MADAHARVAGSDGDAHLAGVRRAREPALTSWQPRCVGRAWLAVLLGASPLSCDALLNVDGVVIERSPERDAGGAGGPEPVCERGDTRCVGAALQICREDRRGYRTARVCSTPELCCGGGDCGAPGCRAPECVPGDYRCAGSDLELCNDGQTGFVTVDTCASAAHCSATLGRCTDAPCTPQQAQCNAGELEVCRAQVGWQFSAACAATALCDVASESCMPSACGEGAGARAFLCETGNLLRCNDAQTGYEFVEACANSTSCIPLIGVVSGDPHAEQLSLDELESLGCQPPVCSPGSFQCRDRELYRCNSNRTAYSERVASCESAAHCNASLGACLPAPCAPGDHQCNGNLWQRCEAGGWVTERECASAAQCSAQTGCSAALCEPMDYACAGAELRRCNASGTGWVPVQTCATPGLCSAPERRCQPPACEPGQRRCSRAGELESCAEDRSGWVLEQDCAAAAGVAPGAPGASATCDPVLGCGVETSCAAGAFRCNGQYLERCRDDAWRPHQRCASAALCDPGAGGCREPACAAGSYQCRAPGSAVPAASDAPTLGLELHRCNDDQTGHVLVRACSASEYCDAAHGQCDICASDSPLCFENDLYQCSADGQERSLDRVCSQGCEPASEGSPLRRAACREDRAGGAAAD